MNEVSKKSKMGMKKKSVPTSEEIPSLLKVRLKAAIEEKLKDMGVVDLKIGEVSADEDVLRELAAVEEKTKSKREREVRRKFK